MNENSVKQTEERDGLTEVKSNQPVAVNGDTPVSAEGQNKLFALVLNH